MRIYTKAGDLAFSTFTFPDGQPHFKLETYEIDFKSVTVEMALRNPTDLFTLALVVNTLRQHGFSEVNVDIRYLLGARMDRAISSSEPYTLSIVAQFINSLGLSKVRILDVHSDVAVRLIRNSVNVLPYKVVRQVLTTLGNSIHVVAPDKGAIERVVSLTEFHVSGMPHFVHRCEKVRDPNTGALSGFKFANFSEPRGNYLIVDDICDGGGTFVGIAKKLKEAGASKVFLFVTHGVFSKGLPLEGIDWIYTTDSYDRRLFSTPDIYEVRKLTIIPVSMKELP